MGDPARTDPAFVECANCGFWLTAHRFTAEALAKPLAEQPSCPNCGVTNPTNAYFWKQSGYVRAPRARPGVIPELVGGAMVGGLTALVAFLLSGFSHTGGWTPWVTGIVATLIFLWADQANRQQARFRRRDCLQQVEQSLQADLDPPAALLDAERHLRERIERLGKEGRETGDLERSLEEVREALADADRRRIRARALLFRIEATRWQNRLEPLVLEEPAVTDDAGWLQRSAQLRQTREEGEILLQRLEQEPGVAAVPEAQEARRRCAELLAAAERLESELLARQAAAAVREARPGSAPVVERDLLTSQIAAEQELRHALITHRAGDPDQTVRDLRSEQSRLHAETEQAIQTVQTIQGA